MSLLNNNFIDKNGNPITGRVPTQLQVYAPEGYQLSNLQYSAVMHAYKLFCDNVRLSAATFHVQNRELGDGTKIRMESNNGVDRVMVWPVSSGGEEEFMTFFGIPFDETYLNTLLGTPGELPKEPVFYMDKVNVSTPTAILDQLRYLPKYLMLPSTIDSEKRKPSQPGNTTWFAKGKKRQPALSWWGQYSRYCNSQAQRSKKSQGVWGRSLLESAVFWENETSPSLAKYPAIYNADRGWGSTSSFAVPAPIDGSADSKRDYIWIGGMRVKTGLIDGSGMWILSACVGNRIGSKVVRVVLGTYYPEVVAEVGYAAFIAAAKNGYDLAYSDFTTFTISPTLPETLGIAGSLINWQSQPPYWNSSGSEAMGIVDHYFASGISEITYSLYKLTVTEDVVSAALIESATVTDDWSYSRDKSLTGSYPVYEATYDKAWGATESNVFSGEITAAKPIAADYDGDSPVILRMTYSETMSGTELYERAETASYQQTVAPRMLTTTGTCTVHGATITATAMSSGAYEAFSTHSGDYSWTSTAEQTSSLTQNGTALLTRTRNYSCAVTCLNTASFNAPVTETMGSGETGGAMVAFHGDTLELGTVTSKEEVAYSRMATDTYSRTLSVSETMSGVCSDYSIVGDLRAKTFIVHESAITPGVFASDLPGDGYYMRPAAANVFTIGWLALGEGSHTISQSDSGTTTRTATATNNTTTATSDAWSGTWSHSASGSASIGIPENLGRLSLVVDGVVTAIDTASSKESRNVVLYRSSYTVPSFTSSASGVPPSGAEQFYGRIYSHQGTTSTYWGVTVNYCQMTYGYTQGTYNTYGVVTSPPTTSGENIKTHPAPLFLRPEFAAGVYLPGSEVGYSTPTSDGGIYLRRISTDGYGQFDGPGGYPYYTVASSAASRDGRIVYIGYQTETLIQHTAPSIPYVVKLDLWLVDGSLVVPTKKYPVTGSYKMFSCPVFV